MRLPVALALFGLVACHKPESAQLTQPVAPVAAPVAVPVAAPAEAEKTEDDAAPALDPQEFSFLLRHSGKTFVVLAPSPDEAETEKWSSGPALLVSSESPVVTRKDVVFAALPAPLASRQGLAVDLFGERGAVCHGKLGAFSLVNRVEPHFGTRQRWTGEGQDDGSPGKPMSPGEIAQEAWDLSTGGSALVAELADVSGDCASAIFARPSALAAPKVISGKTAPPALAARAVEQMRKLPKYAEIEKDYRASTLATPTSPGRWEELPEALVTTTLFAGEHGSYLWLTARAGEICTDFSGELDVLFEVKGSGSGAALAPIHESSDDFNPSLLLDLDGSPTLLGVEQALRKTSGEFGIKGLTVPFLDCPC